MKKSNYIYIFFIALLFITSCSTKKNKAINRGFHSMTTKYNILYNGDLAFQSGIKELNANYKDDYWKRLPIEPLKVEEFLDPGMANFDNSNGSFDKAEEKAVKAVQKHSMYIRGSERNKQIDDAYLLLGKSRYYSQRFLPSLEAFNFVLENYPTASLIFETKIWQAKTQLRLRNEEQALRSLKLLLNKPEFLKKDIIEDAHTAIAMVYTAMDSTEQVIHHLKQATLTKENKEQTARNLFILGQVYQEKNYIDSSQIAFRKVIDMKQIPYKYLIHSKIETIKNRINEKDTSELIEILNKLIKDRYNRPYLDELHYQTGLVHQKSGRLDLAVKHFIMSAHSIDAKNFQKGLAYEQLGNMSFDKSNYIDAGAYYDSVINISANTNTKRLRNLKRKRKNLEEVISFEEISHHSDSILNLVAMSLEERETFFQAYVNKLKEADKKAKEEQEQKQALINSGFKNSYSKKTTITGDAKWYFYNTQVIGFGQQEFRQVWGNRPLEDNWRLSDKTIIQQNQIIEESEDVTIIDDVIIEANKRYNILTYLDLIPTDKSIIDSISAVRNNAYYNLGLIYKEQFKKNEIATTRLEKLLEFSPAKKYILPSNYHLYKIYLETNPIKAENYKNKIVTNNPDSKYAKLILNPQALIFEADDENSPKNIYEKVYCDFEEEKYDEVILKSENAIQQYEDLPILPKFELLRAYAIGRKEGLTAFKTALEYVALNYTNTEEGKKAIEVIETISKLNEH